MERKENENSFLEKEPCRARINSVCAGSGLTQLYDFLECFRMFFGKLSENFPVEPYVLFFERGYKSAVIKVLQCQSAAQLALPVLSKRAFLRSAVAVCVCPSMAQGVLCQAVFGFPSPAETLGPCQGIFSAFMGDDSSFYAGHSS